MGAKKKIPAVDRCIYVFVILSHGNEDSCRSSVTECITYIGPRLDTLPVMDP